MLQIYARPLERDDFAPFGTIHRLLERDSDGEGEAAIVRSSGEGWSDAFTRGTLLGSNGSLGMTRGEGGDFITRRMERHLTTQEALFCAADPVVLAVAPPTEGEKPHAEDVRAFVIAPGTVAVLHRGTWHDACRGIDRPAYYYWMATTGGGAIWVELDGGPVKVATTAPEQPHG